MALTRIFYKTFTPIMHNQAPYNFYLAKINYYKEKEILFWGSMHLSEYLIINYFLLLYANKINN